jgi:hypothetical protein
MISMGMNKANVYHCEKCQTEMIAPWGIKHVEYDKRRSLLTEINKSIQILKENNGDEELVSDGYHTFKELYYHRMYLFSIVCNKSREFSRKSKLHDDGTMYDDYFIVWINTPEGDYSYHYHMDYWDMFDVEELDRAPAWDGHKPEDIDRLGFL